MLNRKLRLIAFAMVIAAAIAAVGCSSSSTHGTSVPTTPQQLASDTAAGQGIVLQLRDLPAGFEKRPRTKHDSDDAALHEEAKCLGIAADARHRPGRVEVRGDNFVQELNSAHLLEAGSAVVIEPSSAGLAARFSALTNAHGISCVKSALETGFATNGKLKQFRFVGLTMRSIHMDPVGDQRAAIEGTFTLAAQGQAIDSRLDYYCVRRGRMVAQITAFGFGMSFSPVVTKAVIAKVVARLDAAS